ncbi:helix-turn-helix domain-containing protein [Rhizobium skierniewicense]|uniref:helix-turn-helix transcriptional regulator n=1 Tax=Rhizobium skierniewicense TaxID=984260 RepID=UPI0015738D92|nr:helix-turn-helix domain-containing protein [Rhizobium skierniewicense]
MIFNDNIGFYSVNDICRILNIGRATFYRLLADPEAQFPPSNKLTSKKGQPKWFIPHVHAWIREKLDQASREADAASRTRYERPQRPQADEKACRT